MDKKENDLKLGEWKITRVKEDQIISYHKLFELPRNQYPHAFRIPLHTVLLHLHMSQLQDLF